jgi:hypothetical protein
MRDLIWRDFALLPAHERAEITAGVWSALELGSSWALVAGIVD